MPLKYKIVSTVFLLGCAVVTLVVWQVTAQSTRLGRERLERTYGAALTTLVEESGPAMGAGRGAALQDVVTRLARDPNVVTAAIADGAGKVVVSSRAGMVGARMPATSESGRSFWLVREFGAGAGGTALAALEISVAPLAQAARRGWETGIVAGLIGMTVLAGFCILFCTRLQRRFERLALALGEEFSASPDKAPVLTGTDEVADLGRMLSVMGDRLEERRRELRESEHLLRLLMDAVPVAIVYIDRNLRYRLTNKTFESWFGMSRSELLGRHPREVMGEEAFEIVRGIVEKAPKNSAVTYEALLPYEHAGNRYVAGSSVPHLDEDGKILGYFVAINDLTERHRAEESVVEARDAAQQADAAKTRFLAAASHDPRQPLHAMRLLLGVLSDRAVETTDCKIIDDLEVSLHSMDVMLNSLLDISKLDSGAVVPEIREFEVGGLLDRLSAEFAPEAAEKGLDLRIVPSGAVIRSDPALLERILANLLSNAIRYTDRGKLVLGCRHRGRDLLRIEVWDSGIGIPVDQMSKIFEEYYQIGNPARDRNQGLGLGLALVDRLARLLAHPVDVTSTPGKGSVFAVEVPLVARTRSDDRAAPGAEPDVGALAGRHLFVIEDDFLSLRAMQALLESWGADVVTAADGAEVETCLAGSDFVCDLIVADYRLPEGRSGTEIVTRVRQALGRSIPAVIVTGDASPLARQDAEAIGCRFAQKPLDPDRLLSTMLEMLERGAPVPAE